MYFYGSLSMMAVSFIVLMVFYFRTKLVETKIFFQTSIVVAFYVLLFAVSRIGLIVYPESAQQSLAGVGTALVVWGGLFMVIAAFILGIAGAVSSYKEKKTPLMVTSIVGMLVFPFLLPLFVYPFVFIYIAFKKLFGWTNGRSQSKKRKEIKKKMKQLKQKSGTYSENKKK